LKVLPILQIRSGRAISRQGDGTAEEPVDLLARLLGLGCMRVAFVDVDAATGHGNNRDTIAALMRQCRAVPHRVCMQVGGGIRSSDQAQFFLDQGATWLLVGTLIFKSSLVVDQLLARFHEHLTASIDARGGEVHSSGWVDRASLSAAEAAQHVRKLGFRRVLFADIPQGGDVQPDFLTARVIAENSRLPLHMWGSFRGEADLGEAAKVPGLQGVQIDAQLVLQMSELLKSNAFACG
jgi:phosphoribosylformimino-5-aminoimidazole carboxamide ribonucleotide (ProFAR) isomerase